MKTGNIVRKWFFFFSLRMKKDFLRWNLLKYKKKLSGNFNLLDVSSVWCDFIFLTELSIMPLVEGRFENREHCQKMVFFFFFFFLFTCTNLSFFSCKDLNFSNIFHYWLNILIKPLLLFWKESVNLLNFVHYFFATYAGFEIGWFHLVSWYQINIFENFLIPTVVSWKKSQFKVVSLKLFWFQSVIWAKNCYKWGFKT